jgi:hypothetical protein
MCTIKATHGEKDKENEDDSLENEKESTDKDYINVKDTEDQIEVSEPNRRKS